jgi:protein tyrosine phosphatase (PTP) superfamily phosphohydrolase (DUF442 family)
MIDTKNTKHPFSFTKPSLIYLGLLAFLLIIAFTFITGDQVSLVSPQPSVLASSDSTTTATILLTSPTSFPNIKIKNFGKMDEAFYRGAQPKPGDYKALADLGIKTIIDLRDDPTSYEKPDAEAAGIKYVNIKMSDKTKPPDDQILAFFAVANDAANQPFYVHCAGGRHRTGLIGAVYRFDKYHWDFDNAYKEMKNYDYYSRWGHGDIKDYVQEYYERAKFVKPLVPEPSSESSEQASKPVTSPPPPKPTE